MTQPGDRGSGHEARGAAAISVAALLWGFNYVNTKFALGQFDPFALTLVRVAVSTLFFRFALILARKRPLKFREHWRSFLLPSIFGIVGAQLLWVYGLEFTTPSHSALMFTLMPIMTAILAAVILGERLSLLQYAGIVVAFAGAVTLATEGGISFASDYLYGDLMTLAAFFCFALYTVLSKPLVLRHGPNRVLALNYLISLPFLLPFTLLPALEQSWAGDGITPLGWGALAYLVLFATIGTSHLHQYSLKHLPSTTVAVFANLQPVFAAAASVALGFEQLSSTFYLSAALIFLGLLLFRR